MMMGWLLRAFAVLMLVSSIEKHFGVRRIPAARGDNNLIRLVSSDGRTAARP